VDLAGDFDEAERWVEVIADRVLSQRFDLGVSQAGCAKLIQSVLDELPAEALIPMGGCDGEVGNVTDSGCAVLPGRDVADYLTIIVRHENAGGIAGDVVVDVPGLAPLPIVAVDRSELLVNAVVDGNADEALGGEELQGFQIARLIGANSHAQRFSL